MGFSIGKVFRPIEEEMQKYAEMDSLYLPVPNYKPIGLWKNIRAATKAVKQKKYDIVHITGAEHYLIPFLKGQKVVMTVHDLGFFTNNWPSVKALWKFFLWIKTLPMAECVTFISEKSRSEAERFVKFKQGHAVVIHNPVGKEFIHYPKEINTSCPTILHIGTKSNKNLNSTVIALKDFYCKLRIIGHLSNDQKTILNLYKIRYESVANLTDEEMLQEYINCDYVNFPSLYEGFGMPIIEGQAIGRPVLTSNLSPMKEIAGDGAILINPHETSSISDGYNKIQTLYKELIHKGYANSQRFCLTTITKQYFDIYKQILNR